jgi:hypothetical protein
LLTEVQIRRIPTYWPEPSEGEAVSEGEADGDDSLFAFLEGEGLALDSFFVLELPDDEWDVPLPDFFAVDVVVFVFEAAVLECVVVAAVSCWWHEIMNAAPVITVVSPRTNFFIG